MLFRRFIISLAIGSSCLFSFASAPYVERRTTPLLPVIKEFRDLIESDPELLIGFTLMFEQIPHTKRYELDYHAIAPQVRNYNTMLSRLNDILATTPKFGDGITFPISDLLGWPMCTQAGFDMFMNAKVNAQLKRILNTWAQFLNLPESRSSLTEDAEGWFGPAASQAIPDFVDTYECNPDEEYHGYASWDDFFTRKFREGVRPVDAPKDTSVINNACESMPFRIRQGVKEEDTFWVKGEPYSLVHMLNNDTFTPQFAGGTVFQSYLTGNNYHRWHSPVDGTIVKVVSVPGTYFAVAPSVGFAYNSDPGKARVQNGYSQAFLSNVATRLIIFIQADNPDIGLMAFIAIGMEEVSSCEATVKVGDRVKKGDQLGMFHFGGSTYCMVFCPETRVEFTEEVRNAVDTGTFPDKKIVLLNQRIGSVKPGY